MANIRDLDPHASALDYYGAELRRLREATGLNQKQLGPNGGVRASGARDRDARQPGGTVWRPIRT